jgi:SAM-dependent methyltransferase
MGQQRLTDRDDWDDVWDNVSLPLIYRKGTTQYIQAVLETLDKWLPKSPGLSVLEIGGAVGGYLAYMHTEFGYDVCCMDYSQRGCEKTRENFRLLGINGTVLEGDLFSGALEGSSFDMVYSMGLVEHFVDLAPVVQCHLALLKPGGTLLIGVPSFLGINRLFAKILIPKRLSQHNLRAMKMSTWMGIEKKFALNSIFKGYIGGFAPSAFRPYERHPVIARVPGLLGRIIQCVPLLRRLNSPWISCSFMGIWKKP